MTSRKWEGKEQRKDVHLGLVGDLNLGLPEWQLNVLTTTPCPIQSLVSVDNRFYRLKVGRNETRSGYVQYVQGIQPNEPACTTCRHGLYNMKSPYKQVYYLSK